jgi:hypothetical protein
MPEGSTGDSEIVGTLVGAAYYNIVAILRKRRCVCDVFPPRCPQRSGRKDLLLWLDIAMCEPTVQTNELMPIRRAGAPGRTACIALQAE